jgi:hypothetical protein
MELNLPDKRYYSIGELAKAFDVNTSLLRFWEKEFDILKPKKKRKRKQNVYSSGCQKSIADLSLGQRKRLYAGWCKGIFEKQTQRICR